MAQLHILKAFGSTVRKHRQAEGLSQEDLAVRAEIHRTYIGGIERGERNPTLIMIYRIASALRIAPSELLDCQIVKVRRRNED